MNLDNEDHDFLIGRPRRSSVDVNSTRFRAGSEHGLSFTLSFERDADRRYGHLLLMLRGRVVWGDEEDGLRVDGVALLRHLAATWAPIMLEQCYPDGGSYSYPSAFVRRVSANSNADITRFLRTHDLASWEPHPSRPPFYVLRQGNLAHLECGNEFVEWPIADVLHTLEALANAIARGLGDTFQDAIREWDRRECLPRADANMLALSLNRELVCDLLQQQIIGGEDVPALARDTDVVRVAARTIGPRVRVGDLSGIKDAIMSVPSRPTANLDAMSVSASAELRRFEGKKPHEQGYVLAAWLRRNLPDDISNPHFDIERLLTDWGVNVQTVHLPSPVEAICFWGNTQGPGILLAQRTRTNDGMTRATLAHEACHLLVDRGRHLTVADVQGGRMPKAPEQRANAFAAELLLPREAAAETYRRLEGLEVTFNRLMQQYRVSKTLAARQLLNHEAERGPLLLSGEDRNWLEKFVSSSAGNTQAIN